MSDDAAVLPRPALPHRPGGADDGTGSSGPSAADDARGAAVLNLLEAPFLRFECALSRVLRDDLNPFIQAGAVANTSLIVALVTGLLLLPFYDSSVHLAHASVAAMDASPWTLGLLRSLHRYSSDAAMLFVVIHALRMFAARRFAGARWLAWVTGILLLLALWAEGWTGYWLVWDERGQLVALATARLADVIPVFSTPLSQSFLTDDGVSSLFFFVVFFGHALAPLFMGALAWLHVVRVARPRFLARRDLTLAILAALVILSLAVPADLAAPARLAHLPSGVVMDAWYLWPLALSARLRVGVTWGLAVGVTAFALAIPWILGRKRRPAPAVVDVASCNSCNLCANDCPYGAISMVPRTDGRKLPSQAFVDSDLCVSCGACAGSCDSSGVGVPWLAAPEARARMDQWLESEQRLSGKPFVLLGCAESAAGRLSVDQESGRCSELPGWRALLVPCAAWIHPLTVERLVRRGARGVLVAACPEGSCRHREGATWTKLRLAGERPPALRTDKVEAGALELLHLPATERAALLKAAGRMAAGGPARPPRSGLGTLALRVAATLLLAIGTGALLTGASRAPLTLPGVAGSRLDVSVLHAGRVEERCRDLTAEEIAGLPPHMRRTQDCQRQRSDVRIRVSIDGREVLASAYPAKGAWSDGNSVALEVLAVAPGRHVVRLEVGETAQPDEWTHVDERELDFPAGERRVVSFDREHGYRWP